MDRPSICEALAKEIARQDRQPTLFVEINTGAEPQKAGVLPEATDAFLEACRERYGLAIAGLMCIPPADEPPAPHFALTAKIARRNGLSLLSMGMSADFPLAIAFGATHVRVGTAIFGERGQSTADRSNRKTGPDHSMCDPRAGDLARARSALQESPPSATQPAVGDRLGRARCTNTALPRPATRGRVLWSISMTKS